jgi:hypothetical protein
MIFMRTTLVLASCALGACETGPDVYFGRAPFDAGARDALIADAQAPPDAGDDNMHDDDEKPCQSIKDCASSTDAPYCHPVFAKCVECLKDDDCGALEECDMEGECALGG